MKLIVACLLVPIAVAQYGCTNCQTGYNTNSQYGNQPQGNQPQRDPSASGSEPGYLPDYQGDKFTDPQRIKDTQALNKPFFDQLGYTPTPPVLNPAQQGMTGPQYVNTGNNNQGQQYQGQALRQPLNQGQAQYPTLNQGQASQGQQYQPQQNNVQYQPVNTMYSPQQQNQPMNQVQNQGQYGQQTQPQQQNQQYPNNNQMTTFNNQPTQMQGNQPMYSSNCNTCPQPAMNQQSQQNQAQYGRKRRSAPLYDFMQK